MFFRSRATQHSSSSWLRAAGVLFSTIVGAGVLSLPFVVARVGIVIGSIYIIAMGLVMCAVHLMLAEIVIRTRRHLQLTGLIRKYLGRFGSLIMAVIFMVLHVGAMTAYLIGEGESLAAVFGGTPFVWAMLFFVIGTAIILRGVASITRFDFWMSLLTIAVIAAVVVLSTPFAVDWNYMPQQISSLLIPYGVLLFAFHGTSAIPELEIIVGSDAKALRKAVLVGSLVPIVLYAVFAITVVAVTGANTSQIATIELGRAVGPRMVLIGNIFAIIAMSSSFVTIGQALRRTFQWDYGASPWLALFGAVGIPLLLYIVGARKFVEVIAVVGASCGTIEIILLLWAYWRMNKMHVYEESRGARGRIRRN